MSATGTDLSIVFNSINPIRDYQACNIKLLKLKTKDGKTQLNARMILPHNFDSTKKYPVIVYVYGGPHVSRGPDVTQACCIGSTSSLQNDCTLRSAFYMVDSKSVTAL